MYVLTSDDGGVRTVALNRPDALNAMTRDVLEALVDALAGAATSDDVDVVVLTGTGRAFSAGLDLKMLAETPVDGGDVSEALNAPARRATELLATMPKVTIAKVNGFCFTGALELALACDLMVCADEAKMGDTHAKFGLRPTWGMSARLARAVGITRARELSYSGRTFLGREAAEMGMAVRSVPGAELDATVAELAQTIVANSRASIAAYKDLYRAQQDRGLTEGLEYEYGTRYPMSGTGDRLAGFSAS